MPEHSLVRALLRQVENVQCESGGGQVVEIRVSLGPLSGVEPLLVQSAFEQVAPAILGDAASLVIDLVPLSAQCRACLNDFDLAELVFRCPQCGGHDVRVTAGDEVQLVSVTIRQPEQSVAPDALSTV